MPRTKKPYAKDALPTLRGMRDAHSASAAGGGNKGGEDSDPWHEWRIYLNEDVFRGNDAPTRASLCARIRRAGARVETCYSVGVTHVVTAGGGGASSESTADELDETSKILRGAVMRSSFLRSGSRRSKDLLLKASQSRREPNLPADSNKDNCNSTSVSPRAASSPTPGMPTVVSLRTFFLWLGRREAALGLSVSALSTATSASRRAGGPMPGPVSNGSVGIRTRAGAYTSKGNRRHAHSSRRPQYKNGGNTTSNPEVGPGGELYPERFPQEALTPARSDEISSCMSGEMDSNKAADNNAGVRVGPSRHAGGSAVRKATSKARPSSHKATKSDRKSGGNSSSVASSSSPACAMLVIYDHVTQHKVMSEVFPETTKGAGSVIPTLHEDAPVGMSPFETATKNSVLSAISRERERSLGGNAAVTAKRRKILAQKLKKPLAGYCENCHERYTDLRAHCASTKHSQFARSQNNFQQLDSFLEMLSKARNRSQRRARSPLRRTKARRGKHDDGTAAAEAAAAAAAVVAEAAVAAAAKRVADEEKAAHEKAAAAATERAKAVVEAAVAKASTARGRTWRRSKRLKRNQVGSTVGGYDTTPRNSNPNSIPASVAANCDNPRSMPYNAEFASVLVGSFNNTPAPSMYDPDWVEEENGIDVSSSDDDKDGRGRFDSSDRDACNDKDNGEDGKTRSLRSEKYSGIKTRSAHSARSGPSDGAMRSETPVPPAPSPPGAPHPPRPPCHNRRAAKLLANMVESSVPGVSISVFTDVADSAQCSSAKRTARRSQRSGLTGAGRKRKTTQKTSDSLVSARFQSGGDQENELNSSTAPSSSAKDQLLHSGGGKRKRTVRRGNKGTESGNARSALAPAPCSLKKMRTSNGVGPTGSKSKRLFRAKRRSMRISR